MFTIHDQAAQSFLSPFFFLQSAQAVRVFTDCLNSTEHAFSKNPADYTLYEVGDYDDQDGSFKGRSALQNLGNGIQFVGQQQELPDAETISNESQLHEHTAG